MAETGIKKGLEGRLGSEEANVSGTSMQGAAGIQTLGSWRDGRCMNQRDAVDGVHPVRIREPQNHACLFPTIGQTHAQVTRGAS